LFKYKKRNEKVKVGKILMNLILVNVLFLGD
jgi:hypothetical protein